MNDAKRNTVLIVDDSEINRSMLADIVSPFYSVLEASDGLEAVGILLERGESISLVLLDIVMPVKDGFGVLQAMRDNGLSDKIPVITISADASTEDINRAYDLGAADYIGRPFNEKAVLRRVQNIIALNTKQKTLEALIAGKLDEKRHGNYLSIEILSNLVEFRNWQRGRHVFTTRTLTELFLSKLGALTDKYDISDERAALIADAAPLHDMGKIMLPQDLLDKPDTLTQEEYETVKSHSLAGAEIVGEALKECNDEFLEIVYNICRWHHERFDGGGYPDGLIGDAIPIEAQVVSLADVYDALTGVRPNRVAFTHARAVTMILNGECGVFNPLLLQCLTQVAPQLEEALNSRSSDGDTLNLKSIFTSAPTASGLSERTVELLERERTKYQFFASMSNEIQFEYNNRADILTLSEWGARQLGLPVLIEHPAENPDLHRVFSKEDFDDIDRRLLRATPEAPIAGATYCLHVFGRERWFKAVARPLWSADEAREYIGAIGKFVDVHDEQIQLDKLKHLATQDPLTHLNNHAAAKKLISKLISEHRRCALVLFDLDRFKEANDNFGHMFGDEVLQHVANAVRKNVRAGDIAARIGGDEFMIFLERSDNFKTIVDRIFQKLRCKYSAFEITVSMGIALSPENGEDYDSLFHAADQALYAAKLDGRDRYCYYDESMSGLLSVLSPMDH